MIFLNPLYQHFEQIYAGRINHFPLIKLTIISLDKTIFYMLIYAILRIFYLKSKKRKFKFSHELGMGLFVMYILLLMFLTVFRIQYFPWQIHFIKNRPISTINFIPLIQTIKLSKGASIVDFLYNFYGNILWFIPFGIFLPALRKKKLSLSKTVFFGALLSLTIETLQFLLMTGISDIDDVIFNVLGVVIGYCLYQFGKSIKKIFK